MGPEEPNTDGSGAQLQPVVATRELQRLHVGSFTGPTGTFWRVKNLTKPQVDLLAKLGIPRPKQVLDLQPAPR